MGTPVEILPVAAAVFGIPQYLPQILKLRATGDTTGVSWSWATLTSINNAAWLAYFMLSGYWTASLPSTAASVLAGSISVMLARRGARDAKGVLWICAWAALLLVAAVLGGRAGLGTLLTAASIVQMAPSIWTAYRTARPTGISSVTWALVLGELCCWLLYGIVKVDVRLIALGITGVTGSLLMLTRARQARVATTTREPDAHETPRAPLSRHGL